MNAKSKWEKYLKCLWHVSTVFFSAGTLAHGLTPWSLDGLWGWLAHGTSSVVASPSGKAFFPSAFSAFLCMQLAPLPLVLPLCTSEKSLAPTHSTCLEHQPQGQQKDLREMPVPNLRREGAQAITSQLNRKINTKSICILYVFLYGKVLPEKRRHMTQKECS